MYVNLTSSYHQKEGRIQLTYSKPLHGTESWNHLGQDWMPTEAKAPLTS